MWYWWDADSHDDDDGDDEYDDDDYGGGDEYDGGCGEDENTGLCVLLALQRMGEEHLMLQSQKVKVENFKTSLKRPSTHVLRN